MTQNVLLAWSEPGNPDPVLFDLQAGGFAVTSVADAVGVLAAFDAGRPDAVVLVSPLRGMDVGALCVALRGREAGAPVPVLVVGGEGDGEARALAMGADAWLPLAGFRTLGRRVRDLVEERAPLGSGLPLPSFGPLVTPRDTGVEVVDALDEEAEPAPAEALVGEPFDGRQWPQVLLRWHQEAFSGRALIRTSRGEARVDVLRGRPAAVEGDVAHDVASLVVETERLPEVVVAAAREAARLEGVDPGAFLAREGLLDGLELEMLWEEVVIRRVVAVAEMGRGTMVAPVPHLLEEPGHSVPVASVLWRMDPSRLVLPPLPADLEDLHVAPEPEFARVWRHIDPEGRYGGLRLLLEGRAQVRDVSQAVGDAFLVQIAMFVATGVMRLVPEPPDAGLRVRLLAGAALERFREALQRDHAATADADPWTVLGLPPEVDAGRVEAAAAPLLQRYHPRNLPSGLTDDERARVRGVFRAVLDARRLLRHRDQRRYLRERRRQGPGATLVPVEEQAVLLVDRARRLLHEGQPLAAASLLHLAVLLEGEDPDVLALLGWCRHLSAAGDRAAGEAELRRALVRDPRHPAALEYLARVLEARGDRAAAASLARRLLAVDPGVEAARRLHVRTPGDPRFL